MRRDPNTMHDHELLAELVRLQRRANFLSEIRIVVVGVLLLTMIVLALIYIPKIMAPIRQLSDSLDQIRESVSGAQSFFDGLSGDTVKRIESTLDSLNDTSQKISHVVESLGEGGLSKLPDAINNLNTVLERLTSLFHLG